MSSNSFIIAPSILSADFARLGEEVDAVLSAGADWVHFDVMDNHYVPNLTIGPMVCKALRNHGVAAPIDVHLMVDPVDSLIELFIEAGASGLSIHPDSTIHLDRSLNMIKSAGLKAGIALNPATPLSQVEHVLGWVDMVLVMSVNPGFGGQAFIPYVMDKIAQIRSYLDEHNPSCRIQVDGGVGIGNIAEVAAAGADTFVAGSAIYNTDDYQATITKMRDALKAVR